MDFYKQYCRKHPEDFITNFCNKQECQLELCASCIGQHTQLHLQSGSTPSYQNIKTTYQQIINSLQNQAGQLQKMNDRIAAIEAKTRQKKQKLKQIIRLAQQDTIAHIKMYYQQRYKQMMLQIQHIDKKYGLHSQQRLQNMRKLLRNQISTLKSAISQISFYDIIQDIPKLKMQVIHNAKITINQISAEIAQNQQYNTSISYNKGLIYQVNQSLNKVIQASITRNSQVYKLTSFCHNKFESKSQDQGYGSKQQNLFTLRRPESKGSQSTVGYMQANKIKQQNFRNVFQKQNSFHNGLNYQSRIDSPVKQQSKESSSLYAPNMSRFYKQSSQPLKSPTRQSDVNYNFTFGSQVYPYKIPDGLRQDYSVVSSRLSQPVFVNSTQNLNLKKASMNNMEKKFKFNTAKFKEFGQQYHYKNI